ncbi:hypothetical protein XHV734_4023 [Xanthomonas hortorum pv. vitians]|nr:hypothetical protein XHV734_4023 [Xanthomonas hortorum pv. vitians]
MGRRDAAADRCLPPAADPDLCRLRCASARPAGRSDARRRRFCLADPCLAHPGRTACARPRRLHAGGRLRPASLAREQRGARGRTALNPNGALVAPPIAMNLALPMRALFIAPMRGIRQASRHFTG